MNSFENVLNGLSEKKVKIGQRLDGRALLNQEVAAGWKKIAIVVCGPGQMCDSVRAAVVAIGKETPVVFELEVDAYGW